VSILWSAKFDPKKELIYFIAKDNSPVKQGETKRERKIYNLIKLSKTTRNT
jgi:hypothetical protein